MIVVPALHPAHEIVARVERLAPGTVHRVAPAAMAAGLGGKAVNVARFAAAMGAPVRLILLGDPGQLAVAAALGARLPSLAVVAIPSPVAGRTDLAIVDALGELTVVNGTAADPGAAAVAAVHAATLDSMGPGDVLVLSGSTPDGTLDAHRRLALEAAQSGATVVVDASGPWLRELLATDPFAVKVSAAEAAELDASPEMGAPADVGASRELDASPEPGASSMLVPRPRALVGPPIVAITDGPAGIRAWLPGAPPVRILPPPGVAVVNPLGAGDAVTGGLAIALARGESPLEGLVLGTAMAAASLGMLAADLSPADVAALRHDVVVEPLA